MVLMAIAIGGGLVLLSAVKTKDAKPCNDIQIDYAKGQEGGFVNDKAINKIIEKQLKRKPIGTPLHLFDLEIIEAALEQNAWVADAQLYFDNNQILHIYIDEPRPVARCIDEKGKHFYLDPNLLEMPLSPDYHLDVPVFTGVPVKRTSDKSKKLLETIMVMGQWIMKDTFWLAQVAQIDVSKPGKIEMIPTLGKHIVELGDGTDPEGMFTRLGVFYKSLVAAGSIDAYERINASYSNQIVASGGTSEISKEDRTNAMQTFNRIVTENKKIVNEQSVISTVGVGRIVEEIPVSIEKEKKPKDMVKEKATPKAIMETPEKGTDKESSTTEKNQTKEDPEKTEKIKEENKDKKEVPKPKAIMPKTQNN